MPRSIRDQITKAGIATASAQSSIFSAEALDPRGEHEQEAAEERDRGGGVAGRIARVHRERLEPVDVGPVAMDDQRRRPVARPTRCRSRTA